MPQSYSESALRHFEDAEHLASGDHLDGAGYLIGFAAECAIKAAIVAARPAVGTPHVHLPKLVEEAKKLLQGQRNRGIHTLLNQNGFMGSWMIDVRYSGNGTIVLEQYQRWRADATRILAAANLKRRQK